MGGRIDAFSATTTGKIMNTIAAQMTFNIPADLLSWAMQKTGLSQREATGALLNAYLGLLPIGLSEHYFVFDCETGTIDVLNDDQGRDVEYFERIVYPINAALGFLGGDLRIAPDLQHSDMRRRLGNGPLIGWKNRADGSKSGGLPAFVTAIIGDE